MKCACGGDTMVAESRLRADDGIVRRIRECRVCARRFTTFEGRIDPEVFERARQAMLVASSTPSPLRPPCSKQGPTVVRRSLRTKAKQEAAATGEPVEKIYQRWGVA